MFENHLYSLNVKEHNTTDGDWSKVCPRGDTANKPEGRDGHSTTHAVGRIWVYGGWNEKAYLKDLWHITPRPAKTGSGLGGCPSTSNFEGEWKQEGAEGSALHLDWPPALNSHSMVAYGGFLYLFGGFSHDVSKAMRPGVAAHTRVADPRRFGKRLRAQQPWSDFADLLHASASGTL